MSDANAARVFRDLHQSGLLILPNAWDAGSARIIEEAGAKAIATSSAAVAWARGYPDGEALPHEALLDTVRSIVRVVGVPVSADIEAGFGADADASAAFVRRVMDAGAVGINVEDGTASPELLVAKIARIREAAVKAGVDLWINARTDVYLRNLKEGEAAYDEIVARARRFREAGADSIFVPAAADEKVLARLVRDVVLPLNVLVFPGLPPATKLRELGVRRLSAGAGIARIVINNTYTTAREFLIDGGSERFNIGPLKSPDLNRMMRRG